MELDKFERLGQKISSLLDKVDGLTASKAELDRIIGEKDEQINVLSARISSFEQERSEILSKVDELLLRIDRHEEE